MPETCKNASPIEKEKLQLWFLAVANRRGLNSEEILRCIYHFQYQDCVKNDGNDMTLECNGLLPCSGERGRGGLDQMVVMAFRVKIIAKAAGKR